MVDSSKLNTLGLTAKAPFDPLKDCVVCGKYKSSDKCKPGGTPGGAVVIKNAAEIRDDVKVLHRISLAESVGKILYHQNNPCYKTYTMKKTLESISGKRKRDEDIPVPQTVVGDIGSHGDEQRATRSSMPARNSTSSTNLEKRQVTHEVRCIICAKKSHNKVYDKSRLCEKESAKAFLAAANYHQDDVFKRVADINDVSGVFAADIYYHKPCMIRYIQKYEYETMPCIICKNDCRRRKQFTSLGLAVCKRILSKASDKQDWETTLSILQRLDEPKTKMVRPCYAHNACWSNYLQGESKEQRLFNYLSPLIENMIVEEYGLSLTEIREYLTEQDHTQLFYNSLIKQFIQANFGKRVSFCMPLQKNQSEIVYSSSIKPEDMIQRMKANESLATAGRILRDKLLNFDFGLADSFCDKPDLRDSMKSPIPTEMTTFLSSLLNVPKVKFNFMNPAQTGLHDGTIDSDDDSDDGKDDVAVTNTYNRKILKANGIFQTMFYTVNNGRKRSPLQIMVGHTIYDKCKGKDLITSLNNIGVSVSYAEVQRYRNRLGALAISESQDGSVPMPSSFNNSQFTMVAFDNFDHTDRSSTTSPKDSHDTAVVLFQAQGDDQRTPKRVSDLTISLRGRKYIEELECQKIVPYYHNKKATALPTEFPAYNCNFEYETDNSEAIINLLRAYGSTDPEVQQGTPTWASIHSLISAMNESLTVKKIGFLPFIPQPITDIQTVYTCLVNFKKIAANLQQKVLPVCCDEGVFHLAVKIYLDRPYMFNDLFLMLGSFHTAKCALKCAGKFIRGSGVEDMWIELGIYGPKTVETVLNGTHYYRSFEGLNMLSEAIMHLKLNAFFQHQDQKGVSYDDVRKDLSKLQQSLFDKDAQESSKHFQELVQNDSIKQLLLDLNDFSKQCKELSQQCKFWDEFLRIMDVIRNLVKADRKGDFLLHIWAIKNLCPIFLGCGSINYQRYGTFYYQNLKSLKHTMPELFEQFMKSEFAIQRTDGRFTAVGADMALEQTIQRSAKSTGGIIGNTRSMDYISEWALISHEILAITNLFRSITRSDRGGNNETHVPVHHQLRKSKISSVNKNIANIASFISDQGNPYSISTSEQHVPLKNFVTQVIAEDAVSKSRIDFETETQAAFAEYYNRVYVSKEVGLLDTITKMRLDPVDYRSQEKTDDTSKKSKTSDRAQRHALRTLLMAKEKSDNGLRIMLKYDVTSFSYLFDMEYMTQPDKSQLVSELKDKLLSHEADIDWSIKPNMPATGTVIIDFMSFIRSQNLSKPTENDTPIKFGEFVTRFLDRLTGLYPTCCAFHVVFDSYIDESLKGPERKRRGGGGAIQLARINTNTPLPRQMEKFWKSSENKILLQKFVQNEIKKVGLDYGIGIIFSGTMDNTSSVTHGETMGFLGPGIAKDLPELALRIEEADMRIIPHIMWHVENFDCMDVMVESNDTDVVVLLLHYMHDFTSAGLKNLWIHFGKGKSESYLPVHKMYQCFGQEYSKTVLKCHIATGCDYLSKIGTKKAALQADLTNLKSFAENPVLSSEEIDLAEQYLVQVYSGVRSLQKKSGKNKASQGTSADASEATGTISTFDDVRYQEFKKKTSVLLLAPTSYSVREGHIRRWWYLYKLLSTLLSKSRSTVYKPTEYGWVLSDGVLLPDKKLNLLPDEFTSTCSCNSGCNGKRCSCFKMGQKCTSYCNCKTCKNANLGSR